MTQRKEVTRISVQYTNINDQRGDGSMIPSDIELEDRNVVNSQAEVAEGSNAPSTRAAFRDAHKRPPIPGLSATTNSTSIPRQPIPLIHVSSGEAKKVSNQTNESQDGDIGDGNARSSGSVEVEVDSQDAERRGLLSTPDNIRTLNNQHLAIDDFEYENIPASDAIAAGYPPLNYKPYALQTWFLILTMAIFMACIASITTIIIFARSEGGNGFHISKTRNHVAYRYVPPALGTLTTVWWRMIILTLARMTPYISLAAQHEGQRHNPHRIQRILQNDYAHAIFEPIDLISVAVQGHRMLFGCLVIQFIIMIVIVPLKAVFIQIVSDETGWTIIVVRPVGYTLISIYGTLTIVTFLILLTIYNQDTGLKWDPASIADQLALVQGSNIMGIFQGLEFALSKECTNQLKKRSPWYGHVRLGYWRHKYTGSIWHGLACIPPPHGSKARIDGVHDENQLRRIIQSNLQDFTIGNENKQIPLDYDYMRVDNPEEYRYYSAPFLLNDPLLVLYISVATTVLGLTITGLVERRIQNAFNSIFSIWTLDKTSRPIEVIDNWTEGFRYRFLPVFFMTLFNALWLRADMFYRWTEPFSRMDRGSDAKLSILLDYTSCPPIIVTDKALANLHWRVAMFSTLALISNAPPIIATGIFISTPTSYGYIISIEPINFWACFSFLIFYLVCLVIVRPPPSYRLARSVRTIADILSYCYASKLLDDLGPDGTPIFAPQASDDERCHLKYRICLMKKTYQFGLYLGKDGKRHIGFDVATRDEGAQPVEVIKFDPGMGVRGVWPKGWGYMKKPQVRGVIV